MASRTAYPGTAATNDILTAANVNNLPGGWIGYAEITATSNTFTTVLTDITGLSQAVTVNTSRRVEVTADLACDASVSGDVARYEIREGSTTLAQAFTPQLGAGGPTHLRFSWVGAPTSGSHTYKISGIRVAGTGTHDVLAVAGRASFIKIEDIGPA